MNKVNINKHINADINDNNNNVDNTHSNNTLHENHINDHYVTSTTTTMITTTSVLGMIRNVKDGGGLRRARQIAWEDLGDSPVRTADECVYT